MKSSNEFDFFYEAMWFGDDKEESPIIIGSSKDEMVNELIDLTEGKSGFIEVYKVEYNNFGHKIALVNKIRVLNEFEI